MSRSPLPVPPVLPVLVAAGVLVRRDDLLLLQRRGDDGTWGVPGGALEPGETLEQTARRELLEETGLSAGALTLLDTYSGPDFRVRYPDDFEAYVVGATFETSEVTGSLVADGDETLELAWFPVSSLPVPMSAYTRALLARVGIATTGTVRVWRDQDGWGVIDSPATPGGCWFHVSSTLRDGPPRLVVGDPVHFTYEAADQDGFSWRALVVWPPGVDRARRPPEPGPPSEAHRSTLTVTLDEPGPAE